MITVINTGENQWEIDGELEMTTADTSCDLILEKLDLTQQSTCILARISHMDSAGLAVLLEVQKQAHARKGHVHFAKLPEQLTNLVSITGVDKLLDLNT